MNDLDIPVPPSYMWGDDDTQIEALTSFLKLPPPLLFETILAGDFMYKVRRSENRLGEAKEGQLRALRVQTLTPLLVSSLPASPPFAQPELPLLFFSSVSRLLSPSGTLYICHIPRNGVTYEMVVETCRSLDLTIVRGEGCHE